MAGTNILINLKRGDEVVVYAYTGTWLADFCNESLHPLGWTPSKGTLHV